MTIAPWLQRHLETTGRWNPDGIRRRASLRRHHCHALVVVGLDGDRCATPAVCDLDPLTPLGEALALLGGRTTYALRHALDLELELRGQFHIAGSTAGSDHRVDVVAEHRCGADPLPHFPPNPSEAVAPGDEPPF